MECRSTGEAHHCADAWGECSVTMVSIRVSVSTDTAVTVAASNCGSRQVQNDFEWRRRLAVQCSLIVFPAGAWGSSAGSVPKKTLAL